MSYTITTRAVIAPDTGVWATEVIAYLDADGDVCIEQDVDNITMTPEQAISLCDALKELLE